jgi:hypothetical protein
MSIGKTNFRKAPQVFVFKGCFIKKVLRGFGYIDFKTNLSVKEAVEGMNGFDLGGQYLKVGRCVTPPDALHYLSSGGSTSALPAAAAIGY